MGNVDFKTATLLLTSCTFPWNPILKTKVVWKLIQLLCLKTSANFTGIGFFVFVDEELFYWKGTFSLGKQLIWTQNIWK